MNVFIIHWDPKDTEPDQPKLGLDWYRLKPSYARTFRGLDIRFHFYCHILEITFVTSGKKYRASQHPDDRIGLKLFPW